MPCIKVVGEPCRYCKSETIKFGKTCGNQRYRCKKCRKIQLDTYKHNAYQVSVNAAIADHIKEGCGIRSIARLLHISANTVLKRIKAIAGSVRNPVITIGR